MSRLLAVSRLAHRSRARAVAAAVVAVSMIAGFSGCGATSNTGGSTDANGVTEIALWTWQSTIQDFVKPFEKSHPNIKIKVSNVGANEDEYMQLTNALSAGRGIPDLVYLDFNAVHQFAISDQLRNVNDYGWDNIKGNFTAAAQRNVTVGGSPYGLPISSGPMVMFYNQDVFSKAGISSTPTTWDEYRAAAQKIADLPGNAHITNDTGDGGFIASMLWQAGATPFSVDGSTIGINMNGKNVKKFTTMWQQMLDDKLIDTSTTGWTDEWWRKLDDGSIATMLTGAWMVSSMERTCRRPRARGAWRRCRNMRPASMRIARTAAARWPCRRAQTTPKPKPPTSSPNGTRMATACRRISAKAASRR